MLTEAPVGSSTPNLGAQLGNHMSSTVRSDVGWSLTNCHGPMVKDSPYLGNHLPSSHDDDRVPRNLWP